MECTRNTPHRFSYEGVMTPSSTHPWPRLIVALLVTFLGWGCSDQGPEEDLLHHVEAARNRWGAVRPDRYTYGLYRICECLPDMAGPVSVWVQGVEPIDWIYEDGRGVPPSLRPHFPSVDGLLDLIEDAIRTGAWEVTVTYDTDTGVPVDVRIDYEPYVSDEEAYYRVVSMPRPPDG